MDKILDSAMIFLYKDKELDKDEAEIVRYGLEILLIKLFFSTAILIMSIFMGSFWECIAFLILFPMLRSYAGGYHAKTRIYCFISSMASFALVFALIKLSLKVPFVSVILAVLALVSAGVIWRFAPIDTENKTLDNDEKSVFRKKTIIVMTIEFTISAIAFLFHWTQIQNAALLSVILSGALITVELKRHKTN